jgi:signal transduction histidine kinase/ligand-binding sensor domain-containing protein
MSASRRALRLRIPRCTIAFRPFVLAAVLACPAVPLEGQARVVRTFASESGLTAPPVWTLAQDDRGFLWVGAEGGLYRFDGREIRQWAPDEVRGRVVQLALDPRRGVVALEGSGRAWVVHDRGVTAAVLPHDARDGDAEAGLATPGDAPPAAESRQLAIDGTGTWWFIRGNVLWMRGAGDGDSWRRVSLAGREDAAGTGGESGSEAPVLLFANPTAGGVLVSTDEALWRVSVSGAAERLLEVPRVRGAIFRSGNRIAVLASPMGAERVRVVEWSPGGVREISNGEGFPRARAIGLVERQGVLWASLDRYLVGLTDDGPGAGRVDVLDGTHGVESGGPLLVDAEGSLWLGSFAGLHQLPEPDTRIWREPEGLPSRHARFVARTGSRLWVSAWGGGVSFVEGRTPSEPAWRAERMVDGGAELCGGPGRGHWTMAGGALVRLSEQGPAVELPLGDEAFRGCTPALGGGVWVATDDALRRVRDGRVEQVQPAPEDLFPKLHDDEDRLWLAGADRICAAEAAMAVGVHEESLDCSAVPGLAVVTGMIRSERGTTWAGTSSLGLLAYSDGAWVGVDVPGLPTRSVFALEPSPLGGIWIVANGLVARAVEVAPGRIRIVERLSRGQGIFGPGAGDLAEESDGTIWLATSRGVVQLPPSVRFSELEPPRVELVDARVDGLPVVATGGRIELPRGRNRLVLRFAALSFRDPGMLRHEVRVTPDTSWMATVGEPVFQWTDLRPGNHHVEYRASLDGERWSEEPLVLDVRVLPPWYASLPFRLLIAGLVALLAWTAYRARVSHLVELERQRTRIATDLHDQVGSGLASVGILSSLLANGHMADRDRRGVALEVAGVAEELGVALSDIVWTLDPRVGGLAELAGRLAEHGERLFGDGEVSFTTRFPERWPTVETDMAVRRAVLLVGLEALHNAARHSNAAAVGLSLEPGPGSRWTLIVEDDGDGFHAVSPLSGGGRGLSSMGARARDITADLTLVAAPGRGTRVELRFPPQPPRRGGLARWLGRGPGVGTGPGAEEREAARIDGRQG